MTVAYRHGSTGISALRRERELRVRLDSRFPISRGVAWRSAGRGHPTYFDSRQQAPPRKRKRTTIRVHPFDHL